MSQGGLVTVSVKGWLFDPSSVSYHDPVPETNRKTADKSIADQDLDWCPLVSSTESGWISHLPFALGALGISLVAIWQIFALRDELDSSVTGVYGVPYCALNLLACLVAAGGLYLLHRTVFLNRSLRRSLQLAQGLQEMQSALRKRNHQLEMESRTDPLTGAGNRLLMGETLEFETQRSDRYGDELSIALVEIGGLRRLHVRLGRNAVETVIRATASRIMECVQSSDWVFRWSGGEFVILWPNATAAQGQARAERIHRLLCDANLEEGFDLPISVGATTYVQHEGVDRFLTRLDLSKCDLIRGGVSYLSASEFEESNVHE